MAQRRVPDGEQDKKQWSLATYQAVAQRRAQYDTLMWQVPALGLTAQAFLLTITLGHESGRLSRILASGLAALVSVLTMQLMAKHRWHERVDSQWLEEFEKRHGLDVVHQHRRRLAWELNLGAPGFAARWRSYRLWQFGIGLFGAVGLACAILALVAPHAFAG
ncbi:hypothetical protein [Saccharopolyspora sp. NPDC002376]